MPRINIKKYSRSNVDTPQTESEIPEETDNNIIVKKRGRPKKATPEYETPIEDNTPQLIEAEPETFEFEPLEAETEPFLDELNNDNYQEPSTENEQKELQENSKNK